jgi:hypothetical protein
VATREEQLAQAELLRIIADQLVRSAAMRAGLPPAGVAAAPFAVREASEFIGEQLGVLGSPSSKKTKRKRNSRAARAGAKKMSKALKAANAKYRKKNGDLRAGRTQADIMRYAHKLRRKM